MAEWKVILTITRDGHVVDCPETVFGAFGAFTGDHDGIVEIETERIPNGTAVFGYLLIRDPSDGGSVVVLQVFEDMGEYDIRLEYHGRFEIAGPALAQ